MTNENQDQPELLDHEYDGIKEYDNPLPNWWLWTFFITIIFGALYYVHYTVGGGLTQLQELEVAMNALPKAAEKIWGEDELKGKMESPDALANGKAVFSSKCAACHGAEGQGIIGPNLADSFWMHGKGKRADIVSVIAKGVTEKGMPAWSGMISENEIIEVSGFIYSLRESNPPNAKEPQGEEFKE